jgi:hypothetical protein
VIGCSPSNPMKDERNIAPGIDRPSGVRNHRNAGHWMDPTLFSLPGTFTKAIRLHIVFLSDGVPGYYYS